MISDFIIFVYWTQYAENNGVQGAVPTEFGNLQSSETLWLSKLKQQTIRNYLTWNLINYDIFLMRLFRFNGYVHIHSENQGVSGGMPSELANMGKLSQVSFGKSNMIHLNLFLFITAIFWIYLYYFNIVLSFLNHKEAAILGERYLLSLGY